jgi:hypothetical protein
MTIPTLIEKDIKSGKARYQTFQTGMGGQSVLPVNPNSYIIIFGYDFSPAGGGLSVQSGPVSAGGVGQTSSSIRAFETQQLSFYTGQAFHPFIHHVNVVNTPIINSQDGSPNNVLVDYRNTFEVDTTPIKRGTYIISNSDVAITVGLIQRVELNAANLIPVTNKTPPNLTYGGSAAVPNVESIFSSNDPNPLNFVQPSLKDFLDYGLGGVPGNAQDQAFAIPDQVDGLIEPSQHLQVAFGLGFREAAASNYFLNVHYAIYTNQTPEQLG